MHLPWIIKHKPKSLKEVVGNEEAKKKLVDWVKSWEKEVPAKKAVLLYGPPGVGKTVSVEALANDLNMELIETNASDYRTESALKRIAGVASQYSTLTGRKRLILLDELDGISGTEDVGGLKAIIHIIDRTRCPIILVANDAYDPRFRSLREKCLLIEFKRVHKNSILKHLQRICEKEGIKADIKALRLIADRSEGDVRSAVNDLQAMAQGRKELKYEDVAWLAYRDRKENIFKVLSMIFYAKRCTDAKIAASMSDLDPDMLFEWIYENAPRVLTDPHDLVEAMDTLAEADLYRGRIKFTQNWRLLTYVLDLMTAGIAMAREKSKTGWIKFQFPQRIKRLQKLRELRSLLKAIGMKIRKKCHVSATRAISEVIPYLKIMFENDIKMAAGIARWLELDHEMIRYLAGGEKKAKEIIKLARI